MVQSTSLLIIRINGSGQLLDGRRLLLLAAERSALVVVILIIVHLLLGALLGSGSGRGLLGLGALGSA
jgi:hypothetical protein